MPEAPRKKTPRPAKRKGTRRVPRRPPHRSGHPKKLRVTMLMDPGLKAGLEALAEPLGIGYQTLAHIYLARRVPRELKKAGLGGSFTAAARSSRGKVRP